MESTPLADDVESDRVRSVAVALAIPLGVFGAHRFYVGKVGTGILQLCTLGGGGLWWLYDFILILTGEFRDSEGRRLSRWSRDDSAPPRIRDRDQAGGRMIEELDSVQTEVRELAERVDFLERLLAQVRERGQVGAAEKK
jgi:hypothetical protein